jgi:GWxTD domain-containing protein
MLLLKNKYFKHLFLPPIYCMVLVAIILAACNSQKKVSNQNLSYSYKSNQTVLHPMFEILHENKDYSNVYFSISTADLLYVKSSDNSGYSARVSLTYKVLAAFDSKNVLDTGSVLMVDKNYSEKPSLIIGKAMFKASYPFQYVLEVVFQDLNRNISVKSYINVNKLNEQAAQNFILTDNIYNQPLFRNYLQKNEIANIKYKGNLPSHKLFVRYYNRQFPLPPPAFSNNVAKPFMYAPDSTFVVHVNDSGMVKINFKSLGFYHIQTDTLLKEGFTIYRFNETFPFLTQSENLVPILRFITTRQEYDDILNEPNKKKAIDEFWIKNAGTPERAKQIIRSYYGRAQEANQFFTSYLEGWKSDRGLIYIIFGQPNTLYKENNAETWVYGEEGSYKSLSFSFVKVINPFSENDYQLNRSDIYKDEWYRSVDTWRQGRTYNDK